MTGGTPILEVRGLSVRFGGLVAVNGVDLAVARGRVTSVIGPNGAGKSTLFNLVSGAVRPTRGSVRLEGIDVTGRPPHAMCAAGLARSFQITNVFLDLTVHENLRLAAQVLEPAGRSWLPARASRRAQEKALEQLERFGLTAAADRPAGHLSHGEQRRLEIAMALACEPRILLLDEPTQGMSHGETIETARLVAGLAGALTILLIEHDVGLVMDLSDHVVVMHQGSKLAEGTPAAVRADPAVQAAYLGRG